MKRLLTILFLACFTLSAFPARKAKIIKITVQPKEAAIYVNNTLMGYGYAEFNRPKKKNEVAIIRCECNEYTTINTKFYGADERNSLSFALQQDGTKKFAFMINEEQSEFFHPKSLVELELYFEEQLQKRIEAEMQATQSVIKKEQEARSVLLMDEAEDLWDKEGKEILKADLTYKQLCKRCNVVGMLLSLLVLCCFITAILLDSSYVMLLGFVGLFIVFFVIHFPKEMYRKNKAEEYIDLYIKERL